MRILIYGLNFTPELTGIGKYTGELAESFVKKGCLVRVITAYPYYPQWEVTPGYGSWRYQRETQREIDVYRCPLWVPQDQSGMKRILHLFSFAVSSVPVALTQMTWKPDVVLTVIPTLFSAPVGSLISKVTGAKAWLHIQDFEIEAALGLGMLPSGSFFYKGLQMLETQLYHHFDRISTISTRMMEHLWEKGVAKHKTRLLPNWIDGQTIFPLSRPGTYRKDLGFVDGEVVVQYAGNMGVKQGLDVLVEAAKLLKEEPKIQIVLCGDGAAHVRLEKKAKGMSNVHFIPLQSRERLNELLNFADIHVLPQHPDAADLVMPSKLTNMMASGKPVIATAAPGTQVAKVVSGSGLVVPPEAPDVLAEAIKILASDPKKREVLGSNGRAYAVRHWAKEKILADFNAYLEELI